MRLLPIALLGLGCAAPQDDLLTAPFVDPANVSRISQFRSCCGHDYSRKGEENSSMKHYIHQIESFGISNDEFEIYAPFDGKVTNIKEDTRDLPCFNDTHGFQMFIRPDAQRSVYIKLFHVNPVVDEGPVRAGDLIAYGDFRECDNTNRNKVSENPSSFDISLQRGNQSYPLFPAMTGDAFAPWIEAGVATPDDTVIPLEEREANPCTDYWKECADGMVGLWGNEAYPPYW